ncbi:MAG TPA: tetratricopeptide repeat protein [Steroidobacteraceae bacterium]|jgi:tetratricopeptide (TPR) repeat protein|nr:tetratricopeptide repeat protein [Steroidobacteraceae bacterium]
MLRVLHKQPSRRPTRPLAAGALLLLVAGVLPVTVVLGQAYPGGPMSGGRGMGQPITGPADDLSSSSPQSEKPDAAARKAYKAAMKSLEKAREYEEAAAKATNPDKKAAEMDKVGDAYNRALDQFTEALGNKADMLDAWNNVGYIHLKLGAYNESIDDYNHVLESKPDVLEAVEHRGEAFVAVNRLEDAEASYMDLFNHERPLADQLMASMQKWRDAHRAAPNGVRAADIDAFAKWLGERDAIAKQTASAAPPAH